MGPNRKNLLNFSKFTQKAKKYLGSVKTAEIISDEKYANEIFISSVLYGDSELIELSRSLLDEVNVDKNLIFSVEMYLNSISVKELSSDQVYKRKYFILLPKILRFGFSIFYFITDTSLVK